MYVCLNWRYLDDDEGIKNYFAAFHLHDTFPVSVIIDDFGDFFDERYKHYLVEHPLTWILSHSFKITKAIKILV